MKALLLDKQSIHQFISYCKEHRSAHDDSFLQDDDLDGFSLDDDNPTSVLTNDAGNVIGAASLLWNDRYRKTGRARFRILHAAEPSYDAYRLLIEALEDIPQGMQSAYLFLPDHQTETAAVFNKLSFAVERYAWILTRDSERIPPATFEQGYSLRPFQKNRDELAWCQINNAAFSPFGWYHPIAPEMVQYSEATQQYIANGRLILWQGDAPAGALYVEQYPDQGTAEISLVSVHPSFQGKGLGRNLLRIGMQTAADAGYHTIKISVNGDNPKAADLYRSEGFEKEQLMLCYSRSFSHDGLL